MQYMLLAPHPCPLAFSICWSILVLLLTTNAAGLKYPGINVPRSSSQSTAKGRWWVNTLSLSLLRWDSSEAVFITSWRSPVGLSYSCPSTEIICERSPMTLASFHASCLNPRGASGHHLPNKPTYCI